MEINITDWLSKDEMKRIVEDEFRGFLQRQMKDEPALKRILSNVAYETFYTIVDDVFDVESQVIVKQKVDKIISNPSSYTIFKKPDAWDKETNNAYDFLQQCIMSKRDTIEKIVESNIDAQTVTACKQDIKLLVADVIREYVEEV